jgi:hypothetical protein
MKFNNCFKIRSFTLAVALIAGLSLGAHATARNARSILKSFFPLSSTPSRGVIRYEKKAGR